MHATSRRDLLDTHLGSEAGSPLAGHWRVVNGHGIYPGATSPGSVRGGQQAVATSNAPSPALEREGSTGPGRPKSENLSQRWAQPTGVTTPGSPPGNHLGGVHDQTWSQNLIIAPPAASATKPINRGESADQDFNPDGLTSLDVRRWLESSAARKGQSHRPQPRPQQPAMARGTQKETALDSRRARTPGPPVVDRRWHDVQFDFHRAQTPQLSSPCYTAPLSTGASEDPFVYEGSAASHAPDEYLAANAFRDRPMAVSDTRGMPSEVQHFRPNEQPLDQQEVTADALLSFLRNGIPRGNHMDANSGGYEHSVSLALPNHHSSRNVDATSEPGQMADFRMGRSREKAVTFALDSSSRTPSSTETLRSMTPPSLYFDASCGGRRAQQLPHHGSRLAQPSSVSTAEKLRRRVEELDAARGRSHDSWDVQQSASMPTAPQMNRF
eukprot:NODE_1659_length_1453_cov_38.009972_g1499_i0.p1 GENE.NODE_1659_length_1453_cov_38.009972_g1499_i0~~NODE_1659_length_1453_cov_38.009972_g1499_i0.p1  ORF type:complete len:475 (+),score=54.95 NODE_1659_length_1453_cov_38.009972_g1499_i0:107-1426(+)